MHKSCKVLTAAEIGNLVPVCMINNGAGNSLARKAEVNGMQAAFPNPRLVLSCTSGSFLYASTTTGSRETVAASSPLGSVIAGTSDPSSLTMAIFAFCS